MNQKEKTIVIKKPTIIEKPIKKEKPDIKKKPKGKPIIKKLFKPCVQCGIVFMNADDYSALKKKALCKVCEKKNINVAYLVTYHHPKFQNIEWQIAECPCCSKRHRCVKKTPDSETINPLNARECV